MAEEVNTLQEFNDTQEKRRKRKSFYQYIGIEVGIVAVVGVVFLLILNYYKIISIPGLSGLRSGDNQASPIENTATTEKKEYQFSCPLDATLCTQGKILYDADEEKLAGLAYRKLPENTTIVASFEGNYTTQTSRVNDLPVVIFTLSTPKVEGVESQGFIARYVWVGVVAPDIAENEEGTVVKGQRIGVASGSEIKLADLTDQPYSLYIEVRNPDGNDVLPFVASEDGMGLIPR